jgi:NAD(P)-dependent dehydrogenase (short-subunit alcohol dehydrogenase family)
VTAVWEKLFGLRDKRALIAGASGGIGRVLALGLAEAGALVAVHGTNKEKVFGVGKSIEKAGARYVPLVTRLDTTED